MNYSKKLFWLIAICTLIRLILSGATELDNVEAYYWSWSIRPQWNYVDHPPVLAWLIYLTTLGQHWVNEVSVRLVAVSSSGIATWIIFRTGQLLKDERTGWLAALAYSGCVYTSSAIGIFILPDSPQVVFWMASLHVMLKIVQMPKESIKVTNWLIFGALAGLCAMCKVHGVFLWLGVVVYVLFEDRRQLRMPGIYLSALVTLVIISPFILWNIQHNWYTWKFQSVRFAVSGHGLHLLRFLKHQATVIFLIGPIISFLIWRSVIICLSNPVYRYDKRIHILLYCNLPLIVFLFIVSISREVYTHWPGPAYTGLLVLPALLWTNKRPTEATSVPSFYFWSLCYCIFIGVSQVVLVNFYPGTMSAHQVGLNAGKGDVTADMVGWTYTGLEFNNLYRDDVLKGRIKRGAPLLVTNWTPASATEFYVGRKTGQRVLGVASLDSLHQYYWMNSYKAPLQKGDDAYYIVPSNHFEINEINRLTKRFANIENVVTVPAYRMDRLCRQFYILRLNNYDGRKFE